MINVTHEASFSEPNSPAPTFGEDMIPDTTPDVHVLPFPQTELSWLEEFGANTRKYGLPLVFVIGLIANTLTIFLMQRPFLQKSTTAVYFSALAIQDMIHLMHQAFGSWWEGAYETDLYGYFDITCKLKVAMFCYTACAPAWLVLAITTERFFVTSFPLYGRRWCTKRMAVVVSVLVSVSFAILWVSLSLRWGVSFGKCNILTSRLMYQFMADYGLFLAITLYTFVPSPLLLILNVVLIYQVWKASKTRKRLSGESHRKDNTTKQVTIIALLVSLIYMFLTMPAMAFFYVDVMVNDYFVKSTTRQPVWRLISDASSILREINHACNFFIYTLAMPKMKSEVIAMLTPRRSQNIDSKKIVSSNKRSTSTSE